MQETDNDIQVIKVSKQVIVFRTIVKGRVLERTYLGHKQAKALALFKQWLKTQEV